MFGGVTGTIAERRNSDVGGNGAVTGAISGVRVPSKLAAGEKPNAKPDQAEANDGVICPHNTTSQPHRPDGSPRHRAPARPAGRISTNNRT